MDQFEAYFQRADTDRDGRISGNEALAFFQATNLPKQVLAQIWTYAIQNGANFLGRQEFYNALKLVTVAQSKRDLTPDLVKAALYGPASAQIPAPKIHIAAIPGPQSNMIPSASPVQLSGSVSSTPGVGPPQQYQIGRPPRPSSASGFQSQLGVSSQGTSAVGSMPIAHRPSSSDLIVGNTDGFNAEVSSHVPYRNPSPATTQGRVGSLVSPTTQAKTPDVTGWSQSTTSTTQGRVGSLLSPTTQEKTPDVTGWSQSTTSKTNETTSLSSHVAKEEPRAHPAAVNGFASTSGFGDMFTATSILTRQNLTEPQYSAGSIPPSSPMTLTPSKEQHTLTSNAVQPPAIQVQQFHSTGKSNQHVSAQSTSTVPVAAGHTASTPSQPSWPRMTQSDIQKYSKVFLEVDKDRDGKITGLEASNLFLSWRLPREVLKQVWDLSDQDNDSMLSLREFCIALYFMERYREGRPLPTVLPNSVIFEGTPLPAPGQPVGSYDNASWRPTSGFQQPQGPNNARSTPSVAGKPPRPGPIPQPDESIQQKAKVPVLEKNLVDQLSTEEQDSLNKKFQEAKDAEKKVVDLEKDILEAKQKIQFYHGKMQELILYKSQCDNRLNEITEKVVADKREAESLAKKYEEKYKQSGDVASKLTIEEATFRDIQEKKMELYRAIIKLDNEKADGIQDRTNEIQSELEELVKALNERCKTYGLRGKPTSLVELPFGWQAGISGTAADWDENWDKFEDEGFTLVKELTRDVENVIAPPKPKTPLIREKVTPTDISGTVKSPSKADDKSALSSSGDTGKTARSPPDSPERSNTVESPSKELEELRTMKDFNLDGSPAFGTQGDFGAESVLSGDRSFDEPAWGSFDTHYEDAGWDINPSTPKDADHDRHNKSSLFNGDEWSLNPIRTGPTDSSFSKQGPFFDSVPSTPLYNAATSPNADTLFSRQSPFAFDSVPSTPMYNSTSSPRRGGTFADSVPSTPMYNFNTSPKKGAFADSVPNTPLYNSSTSPRRFSEGSEENNYSFDSFSRFDSFNMHDSGPFGSRDSLTRFDSMRSTRASTDFDQGGYFGSNQPIARFDSFRSTADSDYNFGQTAPAESFTRFDSMRSTRDSEYGLGFTSFDDSDPFGSSEPFRSSHEDQTPRRDSDIWKAF